MFTITMCVLSLIMPSISSRQASAAKVNNLAQLEVDGLATKLASGEIGRVEIVQIPERILTRTRITPEMLEKQYHYKLTIHDIRGGVHQKRLLDALKSTEVQLESGMTDLRWGVVLYGVDERRVGGLFFDKSGRSGAVNNSPTSFKGDLFKWLNDSFSDCFR